MPGEALRILMIVGAIVAGLVIVLSWAVLPPAVYLVLLLAAVAYLISAWVVYSRWCQLMLTSRGIVVSGRKPANINWDRITGFGPVMTGSRSYLSAWVVGAGGGPPKPIRICPLDRQHFLPEAIRAAILSYRPAVRFDPLQPSFGYPQQRPPYQ
jgi:hypothetical protein